MKEEADDGVRQVDDLNRKFESGEEARRQRWQGAPLEDRLAHMYALYVEHTAVKAITSWLKDELVKRRVQKHANGLLVVAPSGCGKSSLIDHLKRLYPEVHTPESTVKPVISMDIPNPPTPKALTEALLEALGDPLPESGTTKQKERRAKSHLLAMGTLIVAIDNFQDVPANRRARGVEHAANWIRNLCDLPFPGVVIALGTEEAAVVRDSHKQLLRRMQARIELPEFQRNAEYLTLLRKIDAKLPLAHSSGLSNAEMAARLYQAQGGVLAYLMPLLTNALTCAVRRGSERIEACDLEQGFKQTHQTPAEGGNPFAAGYDGSPLDKPGQAFHRPSKDVGAAEAKKNRGRK